MLSVQSILTISALALAFALSGCTRPEGDTSRIKIVMPQAGNVGQSTDELMHVVINATGDGIANPILMIWDRHDSSSEIPSSFVLDIPMGSNRMVQVLAVYENSDTQTMKFYYGDKVQTLSSAVESMTIPITSLGAGTPIVSGRIAGRYLTSANAGPTGPVDIIYTPPGKPSLIIERSSIVNGWFHFFGLAGLPFGYRLADGSLLFGKNFDLLDPILSGSQKVLRVAVPASYREENHGGPIQWVQNEPNINVYGFFGPGADNSRYVCKPASLTSLTRLAKADSPTGVTKLTYAPSPLPTTSALLSTTSPLPSYYVEGGDSGSATCSTPTVANAYVAYLKFESNLIDGNGHDNSIGFEVPLTWNASGNPLDIDTSNPRVISGTVLPGVETVVDGFQLFKRVTTESEFHLNQVDCQAVANGDKGFVPAGSGAVNATTRTFSITSNISTAETTSGVSAVLCPSKGGQLASQGIFIEKWSFNGGGGGGGGGGMMGGPPHHLIIRTASSVNASGCTNASVELVDSNGMMTNATTAISFTVAGDGGSNAEILGQYDPCGTGSASASLTIPVGSNSVFFKFRGGPGSPIVDHINVTGISGTSLPGTIVPVSQQILIVPAVTITQITLDSPRFRINPSTCAQLTLRTKDSFYNPVSVSGSTPFTLEVESNATSKLQLFTDPGCTSALATTANNASFSSGTSQIIYYVKGLAEGGGAIKASMNQSVMIGMTPTPYQAQMHHWMEVVSPGQATQLTFSPPYSGSDANSGNCLQMNIEVYNDAFSSILVTGNLNLSALNSGTINAAFYSDSSCMTPIAGGGPIPFSLESSKSFYFKPQIPSVGTAETISFSAQFEDPMSSPMLRLQGDQALTFNPTKTVPVIKIGGVGQSLPANIAETGAVCAEIYMEFRTFSGTPIPNKTGDAIPLNLNFTPGLTSSQVFTDAGCTSGITPPILFTIPPNSPVSNSFYIKAGGLTTGSYQFSSSPGMPPGVQWISPGTLFNFSP